MLSALILSSEMPVAEAQAVANQHGMRLYTNGQRIVVSPVRPGKGQWAEISVKVIDRRRARLEVA